MDNMMKYNSRGEGYERMQRIIDRTESPKYRVYTTGIEGFGNQKRNSFEKTVRQSPPQDSDASYLNERWLYMYGMPDELLYRSEGITENFPKEEILERVSTRLDISESEGRDLKKSTGRDMLNAIDSLPSLEEDGGLVREINHLRGGVPHPSYMAGLVGHNTFMHFDDAAVRIVPTEPKKEEDWEDYVTEGGNIKTTRMRANEIKEDYNKGKNDALNLLKEADPQNDLQALRVVDTTPTFGESWAYKEGARAVAITIRRATGTPMKGEIYDAVEIEVNRLTEDGERMAILR